MTTTVLVGAKRFRKDIDLGVAELRNMSVPNGAAARVVEQAARPKAPVLTGRLRSSLHTVADDREGRVQSQVVYAGVIHYGWRAHGIDPQPFLVDAAHDTEPRWISEYEQCMDRALDHMDKVYAR